ncbi:MAG TPA: prephenate dehydrogenase/arogenate dehydrogenase family protein [Abditibacteriaceae bacterium]|jgi:prephenate dehydrogenase
MLFDTACIVGVGLIGGSFGIAVRERGLVRQVVGAVRREETINLAFQRGAVDNATTDLAMAARGADLIFMAPPVGQMASLCEQLAPVVRADAVITDGGSTKAQIVKDCTRIFGQKAYFVGGHPMAGSERTGVEAARGNLFENAIWVLTPGANTPPPVVNQLLALIEGVGATPLLLNAPTHDALLAVTSHLPHITAAALVHLFSLAREESEVAQQLVAGGWRDSTRVAAGSPEMWRDICLANSAAITRGLDDLIGQLETVRALLTADNGDRLLDWFDRASVARRKQGYVPLAPK